MFTITKILTHNIVFATRGTIDYILIYKGIGFGKKPGDIIDNQEFTTKYIVQDIKKVSQYENIVLSTSEEVMFATEKAIKFAEEELNYVFKETLHISLLDHINFAIYRQENNLKIGSFLTDEYYLLYPELYKVSKGMLEIINNHLKIELSKSEIGAIILHLHAVLNEDELSKSMLYVEIVDYCMEFISNKLKNYDNNNSIQRARLITHLKFALKRYENNQNINNLMHDTILDKYTDSFNIATELFDKVEKKYNIKFSKDEVAYIALHIENLK